MAFRKGLVAAGITASALVFAKTQYGFRNKTILAVCDVAPHGKPCDGSSDNNNTVSGSVRFEDDGKTCTITYKISGLSPGSHGFHIHEKADFSNGCTSAGPHYNPHGVSHGGPGDKVRHVGDLGNIEADESGLATGKITDHLIKLSGEHSIVGRSVMVHADVDDLGKGGHELSSTTGNAGARVACGEIKKME